MFIFNNLLVETMIHTKCINAFFISIYLTLCAILESLFSMS